MPSQCIPWVHRMPGVTKSLVLEGDQRCPGPGQNCGSTHSAHYLKTKQETWNPIFTPNLIDKEGIPWKEVWWALGRREREISWELAEGIKKTLCLRIVHYKLKRRHTKKGVSESFFLLLHMERV